MTTIEFKKSDKNLGDILLLSKEKILFSLGENELTNKQVVFLMSKIINFDYYGTNKVYISLLDEKYLDVQIKSFFILTSEPINFKTFTKKKNKITFELLNEEKILDLIEKNKIIIRYINEIKNLIEMPPNLIYPETLLNYIVDFSKRNKLKILETYDYNRLKKEGFNGILNVGRGSVNKPYMSILEYKHPDFSNEENPIVLIGKGVTYDSGGYSIKLGSGMKDMKRDKSGVCIILGILGVLSKLRIKTHVIGILPMAENVLSSHSFKPDEIIKSHSGKTVEVYNTDAEGRLLIMDCLSLSVNYNPKIVIDIATLTGVNIFCKKLGAIFSNNLKLAWKLQEISEKLGDNFWVLPILEEYIDDSRNTKLANVKNDGYSCYSTTIMGASFLKNFISDKIPWVHFDLGESYNIFEIHNVKNQNSSNGFLTILEYIINS